ncbi:Response regulator/GGDEF domain protein [Hyalangium minutum]|uniref:Response regulator/GGDEF domain protein n=1 Tax=Hyalangium minutum TaxID=394096 RepID=A0A085WXJ8_9BACT|nr:Response regulator/GGDEF domain protein [Hyalangium minutum]
MIVVSTAAEALREVRTSPPEVLLTSLSDSLDGETLCREVKQEAPELPVLLLYMPEEENPEERATAAGADACLVGPLKRTTLVTCVGLMLQLADTRAATRSTQAPAPAPAPESDDAAARRFGLEGPSSPDFDFLKRLLLMEVKRSRRYRYPIALLLMELDHLSERTAQLGSSQRTTLLAEMLGLLSGGVRDIDVIVPTTEGRFVAFFPHTPRVGAMVVAERMRQRVRTLARLPNMTVSMGLSVFEPSPVRGQTQVSFGNLMKDANEALRKAQAEGGDRVSFIEREVPSEEEEPSED